MPDKHVYSELCKEKSGDEEELYNLLPLEGDKEKYSAHSRPLSKGVKDGKVLKILIPNKLFNRLPILLTQMKTGNNSNKLIQTKETRQIVYPLVSKIKSQKHFTTT